MRRIRSTHRRKTGVLAATSPHVRAPGYFLRHGRSIFTLLLTAAIVAALAGCAQKGPPHRRIPAPAKPPEKEIIRPVTEQPAPAAVAATPQGTVAKSLVHRGLTHLDEKNYELAAVRFQDAINVDPRNGEAYYYLALADFYLGQYDVAIGLLEKAMSLLGADPLWVERIENLRSSILLDEPASKPEPL